ncbi:MaoC family dehydratase [Hoyosella sp. YIM 151337]|uniref:MaoC family dehydratase n=1 Tax=Hoyosella sp. YIM 151337 TaxID=2992742 RepID=UPI002434B626|nr:MaoC family dehydratase [Hoyosella sp. YIM 151337]
MKTRTAQEICVGDELPEMVIEATPTFIVSTALATRDFQDVHHDRDAAVARGSTDIFLNILTDNGLVQRYVTEWAGPEALIRSIKIRLGVPCYAYDTLTFSGRVSGDRVVAGERRFMIDVRARDSLGDHVSGSVEITVPTRSA